jgi:hypothetical protein
MRKWQWKVLLGLALLAAVGFLVFLWTIPKHRINRQAYEAISAGMSENQVSDILCARPGNFSNIREDMPENQILQGFVYLGSMQVPFQVPKGERDGAIRTLVADGNAQLELAHKEWSSDDCIVIVLFEKGTVFTKAIIPFPQNPTFFDRIREFIGL